MSDLLTSIYHETYPLKQYNICNWVDSPNLGGLAYTSTFNNIKQVFYFIS